MKYWKIMFVFLLMLLSYCAISANTMNNQVTITALSNPSNQHLSYSAIEINNPSDVAQTITSVRLDLPKDLANKVTVCDAGGSNCSPSYTSSCLIQKKSLQAQEHCLIWFKANKVIGLSPEITYTVPLSVALQSQQVQDAVVSARIQIAVGNDLYVGGGFSAAGSVAANNISRWDGQNWYSLGTGKDNGTNDQVSLLTTYNGDLYVAGIFAGPAKYIAKWNGQIWSSLGWPYSYVAGMTTFKDKLYIANIDTAGIYQWDGQSFLNIVTPDRADTLYSDGYFLYASGLSGSIIKWDGNDWETMSGLDAQYGDAAVAMAVVNNTLYVGGNVQTAYNRSVIINNITMWNSNLNRWVPLKDNGQIGVGGNAVNAFAVQGNNLYVGGLFETAGAESADDIAMWNGQTWQPLAAGAHGRVNTLTIDGNDLYVGGWMDMGIVRWDGQTWHNLDDGVGNGWINTSTISPHLSVKIIA